MNGLKSKRKLNFIHNTVVLRIEIALRLKVCTERTESQHFIITTPLEIKCPKKLIQLRFQ